MAQIRVDVIGDASSLKRALAEAGGASQTAAGHFSSLAKTMVGLGAAFVGASSILEGFKKSVDAAEALNAATRQLDAQLRANGESVKAVAPYVAALNAQFEKLGFTSAETEAAFTRLDRASGSAAIAYKEIGLAADLARAKNISFSQAALLIGKVIDGNTSALNRYGIAIPKGTDAINALAIAHQKLAGQAQAAATPMKVFSATVTDVSAKIGNELLPVIDKYLGALDKWLSKSENQKKITDDVAKGVKLFEEAISAASDVIKAMVGPTEAIVNALGGFKQTLEIILGLKVAGTLASWSSSFGLFGGSVASASTNVGKLRAALLLLGSSSVLTAIGAAAAAVGGVVASSGSAPNVPGLPKTGKADTLNSLAQAGLIPGGVATRIGNQTGANSSSFGAAMQDPKFVAALWAWAVQAGLVGPSQTGSGGDTAAKVAAGMAKVPSPAASGTLSHNQIYSLLINAGFSPAAAANFVGIAGAESGGRPGALNTNAATGDYSAGLFQENFFGSLGPSRVAKYAPEFGLSGSMSPQAFAAWLLKHPAAQAKIAYQQSSGGTNYQPWMGDAYVKAHPELLNGGATGPPGSTTLPDTSGPGGGKKAPSYKLPQAAQAAVTAAQSAFVTNMTAATLGTLTDALTHEENLLKAHHDTAGAAKIAAEITAAQKKLEDSFLKAATADGQAASKAAASAIAAFAKGQDGPAAKYIKAEVADLKAEKAQLDKALAAAPQAEKAAIQTQIEAVSKQIAGLKGVTGWIKAVAEIVGKFSARLKAEGDQYTALLAQQTAASELQAVGYFADTADTLLGINKSIVTSLQEQKATLETEEKDLKAKLASAPASLRAGLKTQIAAIAGKITGLTGSISSAMGTVEQDLASAVTAAQSQFQTAVGNLQSDLDNQLQQNALNASGATADQTQLSAMQAADQLKGLTDSVAAAQKALDADTAAGATSTADQIAQDQAALAAAKRSLDEYNLQIKVQDESATATAAATKQTNDMNTALAGLESDLLSGKITAQQFDTALAGLEKTYGVSVATTSAEFIAVASAARGVEGAFNALISWINSQTGSSIPSVGGAAPSGANPFPPGANTTTTGGPGGGGFNVPVGASGFSSVPTSPPPGASGYTGNIHTPGLQMALGGIVPMLHAMNGLMLHGPQMARDYIPVMANGGEMVLNGIQQSRLWRTINSPVGARSGGGGGDIHIHVAGSVISEKELFNIVRRENQRTGSRNR